MRGRVGKHAGGGVERKRAMLRRGDDFYRGLGEVGDGEVVGAHVDVTPQGLDITLAAGTDRDVIAEINRVLVQGGISVYRLEPVHASLESWFLQVTSRLGDPQ